ncbi:SGNH/GDSL hydrolase family protein [Methylobacterium komagatae]|uniref:SGNH/GDSL hydrolase family protein n=1 Tax=Methylobacterium komagatae TaxID=374425 RepID=A0ABW2BKI0_9HYPH
MVAPRQIRATDIASIAGAIPPIEIFSANIKGDGVTDDSAAIKAAHDNAFSQGVRTVYCAKQYYAPSLSACGNVIFVGQGTLLGGYRKQIIPLNTPGPQTFERGVRPSKLSKFIAAASPVVLVVGDSITTKSDQISGTLYLSRHLLRKLTRENPGKTIQWFERGIPTTGWSHFASSQSILAQGFSSAVLPPWYTNTAATWMSYIQALAPDLIIFNFGANAGVPATEMAGFYSALSQIAAFTKAPDVILLTPMSPSQQDANFGVVFQQEARDQQAAVQRGYALRTGTSFIDINRYFNMARDGRDIGRPMYTQIQQGFGAVLPWTGPSQTLDVSLVGQWLGVVATNVRNGTPFIFNIGSLSDNNFEIYRDQTSGNFKINVRVTGSLLAINGLDTGVPCPTTGTIYWELCTYGNWVQFGYSTSPQVQGGFTPVWGGFVERCGGLFTPKMSQAGSGGQTVFTNSLATSVPTLVMPNVTDYEMYGIVPTASGGSITAIGGNAINHPSAIGAIKIWEAMLNAESFAT